MELVYLWVEDYKNIHKQGFNFSGQYRCDYDPDKKELTIDKNDDHVHIFPENINVTAIVGENGAGKSSICEEILNIISSKILVFNINTIWYIRKPDEVNVIFKDHTKNYQALDLKSFHAIYLHTDIIKPNEIVDSLTYSNAGTNFANPYHLLLKPAIDDSTLDLAKFQKEFYLLIFKYFREHKTNIFDFTPTNSDLNITTLQKLSKKISFNLENKDNDEDFIFRTNRVEAIVNAVMNNANSSNNIQEKFLAFLLKKYVQNISDIEKFNTLGLYEAADYVVASDMIETEDGDYIFKDESTYTSYDFEDKILGYSYIEDKELYTTNDTASVKSKKFRQYVGLLQSIEEDIGQAIEIEEAFDLISYDKDLFFTLVRIGFIEIDFSDDFGRSFFKLSHGERKFFTDSLLLYDEIFKNEKNNVLILLDEPDLALHPRWQKQYISQLISTFSKITEKHIHFLISSHSSFILSDIPKENVVFLKKGKQIDPDIDTFGANIHTLLSHGFFMEHGLMGEFAKSKINEVITLLNSKRKLSKKNQKFCEDVISIIGEPILQKTLQHQLDQKLNTNETELQKLEREQKEIQEKIDKLKSGHHETN